MYRHDSSAVHGTDNLMSPPQGQNYFMDHLLNTTSSMGAWEEWIFEFKMLPNKLRHFFSQVNFFDHKYINTSHSIHSMHRRCGKVGVSLKNMSKACCHNNVIWIDYGIKNITSSM